MDTLYYNFVGVGSAAVCCLTGTDPALGKRRDISFNTETLATVGTRTQGASYACFCGVTAVYHRRVR